MNVEMALEISKLIHDECDNVNHDIGMRIVEQIVDKYKDVDKEVFNHKEMMLLIGIEKVRTM